ncbi:uncharacterized protein N7483_001025 [Penicillium malachiteum]|uniref:uncharacterized protein n=1 Tax=Penicillium malachiteum TaxID=1324776 RepID=UPI0025496D86|nr:uncharacterized protein N7483_001025 [Penicillium malachiteum]KAJ5735900.1 hypothetical protein N7483_001025 [Penicillium malachiteum]
MPLRYLWITDVDLQCYLRVVQLEQEVYRRLQSSHTERCRSIVECVEFLPKATKLRWMKNGNLRAFLANNRPSQSCIHGKKILVADIASRNILIDSDLSIKFCDFTEASLLPLDTDMETIDGGGYNTLLDIALLGAVFYEIVTGEKCEIDLFVDSDRAQWPARQNLPLTEDIWLGSVIQDCWTGIYPTANSLLQALVASRDKLHH